eukprot:CCRYP_018521-RA/>CCRYP_018521-RA protein AED:0.45 eAED:0.90 QI:0/0/0/1/0/0/2/0/128
MEHVKEFLEYFAMQEPALLTYCKRAKQGDTTFYGRMFHPPKQWLNPDHCQNYQGHLCPPPPKPNSGRMYQCAKSCGGMSNPQRTWLSAAPMPIHADKLEGPANMHKIYGHAFSLSEGQGSQSETVLLL